MAHIIAHRGASYEAPENTLSAVKMALGLGIEWIEIDVHLSKDLIPVISHDPHVKSHIEHNRPISEMDIYEIKQFDVGSWFHESFLQERIPTLEEVLQLTQNSTNMMIELKKSDSCNVLLAAKTMELISRYPSSKRIIIGSFCHEILAEIKKINPDQEVIAIVHEPDHVKNFEELNVRLVAFCHTLLTKEIIGDMQQKGIGVWTYTVDDLELVEKLVAHKIDGVITNDPRRVRETITNASRR